MSNKLLIVLLTFSIELVMCFHNLVEMDAKHMRQMEEDRMRGMGIEHPQGMDMRSMDMKHSRSMDMEHMHGMDMKQQSMDMKHSRSMDMELLQRMDMRGMDMKHSRSMDMEHMRGMDMKHSRSMDMEHMRGMDMKHSRSMDMEHMRGMNDDEMRAWKARSNLLRVDAKGKGSPVKQSSKSNETKSGEIKAVYILITKNKFDVSVKQEAQQPGTMQGEGGKHGDKQAEQKPKKCKLNAECYSNAQCGKRSTCEPVSFADKKKKVGTCDCGICGMKIPLTMFCNLNKGPIAFKPKIAIRQCAGLKNACRKDSLFTALETRKCNCEEGFKSAGFKNLEDGQKKLCDEQQCDGEKDTCHGMKCTAGKCNCNLADL
ncbi:hypothetical protein GPALN_005074 [Globodera pallida]|nr:hypothetical protein GPALN_005074 [Globodera pallida]